MSEPRSNIVILAGPNGAGKSTVAPTLLHDAFGIDEFVNADVIASGLSAFAPDSAAITAGRIMLVRLRELAGQGVDFAFETTLASRSFAPLVKGLEGVWIRPPSVLSLVVVCRPGYRACCQEGADGRPFRS